MVYGLLEKENKWQATWS